MYQTVCRVDGCDATSPFPEELCPAHWALVPWALRVRTIRAKYYDNERFWYLIGDCVAVVENLAVAQ